MHARTRILAIILTTAIPVDAWAGPRTTWPSTIGLMVLLVFLLAVRKFWRHITGQEEEAPEPRSKPSTIGAAITIILGAVGSVFALLALSVGEAGGLLAIFGDLLPYTVLVFFCGIYLAIAAR